MTTQAPAGWYPDPSGVPGHRWWDGTAWTASVTPAPTVPVAAVAPAAAPGVGAPSIPAPYGTAPDAQSPYSPSPYSPSPYSPSPYSVPPAGHGYPTRTGSQPANRFALITFAVVAVYLVVAFETSFVFFGILPVVSSLRSQRQREPLAPFAIAAAAVAIIVAAVKIFGH